MLAFNETGIQPAASFFSSQTRKVCSEGSLLVIICDLVQVDQTGRNESSRDSCFVEEACCPGMKFASGRPVAARSIQQYVHASRRSRSDLTLRRGILRPATQAPHRRWYRHERSSVFRAGLVPCPPQEPGSRLGQGCHHLDHFSGTHSTQIP